MFLVVWRRRHTWKSCSIVGATKERIQRSLLLYFRVHVFVSPLLKYDTSRIFPVLRCFALSRSKILVLLLDIVPCCWVSHNGREQIHSKKDLCVFSEAVWWDWRSENYAACVCPNSRRHAMNDLSRGIWPGTTWIFRHALAQGALREFFHFSIVQVPVLTNNNLVRKN